MPRDRMVPKTTLHIRLARGPLRPRLGDVRINELSGGPETLLGWLEGQLGLAAAPVHRASRISEYAAALDTVADSVINRSLATDRWATAAELLSRRDELLLAGWNERDGEALPPLVQDLATAAAGRTFVFPGDATRIQRVLSALDAGQLLPPHRCELFDEPSVWPRLWHEVLSKLTVHEATSLQPQAPSGTALRTAQALLRGETGSRIEQEGSFRYVAARSKTAACEFVAATLAAAPDCLSDTIIYCEHDATALRLDACLQRLGLPTMGASAFSPAHPALQILPLTLSLCWQPVDPQALLDFLTLPIKPLPSRVASRLARALADEPGLGSGQWKAAVTDLCTAENDPDGTIRTRIDEWLMCERVPRGSAISSQLVAQRCSLVARWAAARALLLAEDTAAAELIEALKIASGQAALLGELVAAQGSTVTEPQLLRLLEAAFSDTIETRPCLEAAGGPTRIRSLAEIQSPCRRLVWLGVSTTDATCCRWSSIQLQQLAAAGIALDNGSVHVTALRSAEARGFCLVQETFFGVLTPHDWEHRCHPLWLAIRTAFAHADDPPAVEDLIDEDNCSACAPFTFATAEHVIEPPQPARATWQVAAEFLRGSCYGLRNGTSGPSCLPAQVGAHLPREDPSEQNCQAAGYASIERHLLPQRA